MEFKIYKEAKEIKNECLFRLNDDGDGEITLKVVDCSGETICNVLRIKDDGTVALLNGVPSGLGLQLDSNKRIKQYSP